ncbi:MAG TPA: twin-arginine translocase TatA/TatE family subunit [Candidatus Saccharimonadales bacterium]|jgi:TatA/E family protein of Tat protein translocase|nr:twin-arginine translocase TatA/TatE family subunit [Candidatus Saccharimonadales bacterium]
MLSIPHMIVVFVIVLVVFGPQKLPELARGLGKLMAEFRKASTDFKSAFEEEMRDLERQAREVERRKAEAVSAAAAASTQTQPATLATPSGAETQGAGGELAATRGATEGSVPEAGATDGPVVGPVAEGNVARAMETGTTNATSAIDESATPSESQEPQAKVQKADS